MLIIFQSFLLGIGNISDRSCRGNKKCILCSITLFFRKLCRLCDNVEKYCRAGQATRDNMAHAHCVPDAWMYKHTLRMCYTYCFYTVTIVARARQNVKHYTYITCNINLGSQWKWVDSFTPWLLYSLHCSLGRRSGGLQISSRHLELETSMELRSRGCPHRKSLPTRLHCFVWVFIKLNWPMS
jgi:hypothetical protein